MGARACVRACTYKHPYMHVNKHTTTHTYTHTRAALTSAPPAASCGELAKRAGCAARNDTREAVWQQQRDSAG